MEDEKKIAPTYAFNAISASSAVMPEVPAYCFMSGSVDYDPQITGLGVLSIEVRLPVSRKSLSEQSVAQLQQHLLEWLPQAIREESLREWFKKHAD